MSTNRVNRTGPASGWLPVGARAPTDGGPRKSTNGLETEGGAKPRGEMAGAVEVHGLEHGASRGSASGTTPELDCGMDVGGTGTADTETGLRWSRWKRNAQPLHWWKETVDAGQDGPEHRTLRQRMDWAALEPLEEE